MMTGKNMTNIVELTLDLPSNMTKDEAQTLLAVKLYETGRVSLGQAAKLAGYSKRAFIEILGRHHVPIFNYSPDELRGELGL
jgi:predicted HTH domain antitoxin